MVPRLLNTGDRAPALPWTRLERLAMGMGLLGLCVATLGYVDAGLGARRAFAAFATGAADAPLALLKVARVGVDVPVFAGTDQVTLNRGAGLVEGTAWPGEPGNVVVSAHRDTFFRPLKHIEVGDEIELVERDRTHHFTVTSVSITDALDVGVLDAQAERELTLITCYPFHYVGYAPDRFVVRAVPADEPVQMGL